MIFLKSLLSRWSWLYRFSPMPYFYVCGQVNEKLRQMIEERIVPTLLDRMPLPAAGPPDIPKLTVVFDREAYSPLFFGRLWREHRVAVITYRKNVTDQWQAGDFSENTVEIEGTKTTMELAEKPVEMDGVALREIRRLGKNGHQTSVLTTHPGLTTGEVALYMFSRWSQENFFRYMRQDYDFDKISQYAVEQIDREFVVVNPAYNKLDYKLRKIREKISRRKALLYKLIEENVKSDLDQTPKVVQKQQRIKEELTGFRQEEQQLLDRRKETPHRIKVEDMGENRYNQLHLESKLFRNIIKMICYRAETSFANLLSTEYKKAPTEKRALAKGLINTPVDIQVDHENQRLIITVYTQSTPRYNKAVNNLCQTLNDSQTKFPGTDLRLFYKTATEPFT